MTPKEVQELGNRLAKIMADDYPIRSGFSGRVLPEFHNPDGVVKYAILPTWMSGAYDQWRGTNNRIGNYLVSLGYSPADWLTKSTPDLKSYDKP